MTQQLLYGAEIGAGIQEMGGEAVAQRVHVQRGAARQSEKQPAQRELHATRGQRAAAMVDEQRGRPISSPAQITP